MVLFKLKPESVRIVCPLPEPNVRLVFHVGAIEVSQMDGSLRRTLLEGDILKPSAIALDPSER